MSQDHAIMLSPAERFDHDYDS
jgi:hypothetical protein